MCVTYPNVFKRSSRYTEPSAQIDTWPQLNPLSGFNIWSVFLLLACVIPSPGIRQSMHAYFIYIFRLEPLQLHRAEHLACTMYRLSKRICLLEKDRPGIHLRSRNKVKFKKYNRTYEKYLKNPMARGIILWDRIPESVQRSTTKVKFKQGIKQYLADLVRPVPK